MECHAQLYSHTYKGTHGKEDKELTYFVHNARLTDNRKDNNKAGQSIKGSCKRENGSSQDTGHMVMKSVSLCKLQLISWAISSSGMVYGLWPMRWAGFTLSAHDKMLYFWSRIHQIFLFLFLFFLWTLNLFCLLTAGGLCISATKCTLSNPCGRRRRRRADKVPDTTVTRALMPFTTTDTCGRREAPVPMETQPRSTTTALVRLDSSSSAAW